MLEFNFFDLQMRNFYKLNGSNTQVLAWLFLFEEFGGAGDGFYCKLHEFANLKLHFAMKEYRN